MKSSKLIILLAFLMILIIACGPSQPAPPKQRSELITGNVINVAIKGFKFVPAEVNIQVGESIVWTNEDSAPHTVESSDGVLMSDELSKGDTYKYTFTKAGKHDYICGIHPSMHGSVAVQ